ncbi:MAG: hypothetical protein K0R50_3072 [Eubacterium sp.]|nr:hypothetical protein [Eubacterium sp.]
MSISKKRFIQSMAFLIAVLFLLTTAGYTAFAEDSNIDPQTSSADALQNDLVAKYEFNETSGTTAADSSGNGKNATLTGATFAAGKTGNALSLSGSTQYAKLPSGIVSTCNDITVAAWVKLDTVSSWSRIFDFGTGTSSYMFLTPSSSANKIRFAISNGGSGSEQQINGTAALTTGSWKHVAVTLSGNSGTLYIDGAAVGTNTGMTLNPSDLGATTLNYIGKSQFSDPYLDGLVDDFVIFNRALSQTEIASLAGNTQTGYTRIDDNTVGTGINQFEYVGTWNSESSSAAYSGSEHWSKTKNDYVNIKFYGRQIKVYSSKDTDYGTFCASIDGGSEASWSCWQIVRRNQAIVYESRVLPLGEHTLKIRVAGLKNPDTANTDTNVYIDFAEVYETGVEPTSPAHGDTPVVTTPPSWCSSFYTKCVMVQDIPIVSSNNVADSSLIKAFNIINPMLTKIMTDKPAVYQKLLDNSVKITVEGLNEYNMTLPEWTWQASCDFNATFRGSNGGREALILEDDIIASTSWLKSYCVLAHEFAHTILSFGIGDLEYPGADPGITNQILSAYNAAIAANKYTESSYDRSNIHEYFAGNVGRWFNSNPINLNVPNASSKTPRQQLQEYDPAIYSVLSALFGEYKLPAPWN